MLNKSVALVGFMSAGKTTIGQMLARSFNVNWFDIDSEIVKKAGMSVANIINNFGMDYFSRIERDVLSEVINKGCIISCGGATFINDESFKIIKAHATSLYIKVSPEELYLRLKNGGFKDRPNIAHLFLNGMEELEIINEIDKMIATREQFYNQANHIFPVENGSNLGDVANAVYNLLKVL